MKPFEFIYEHLLNEAARAPVTPSVPTPVMPAYASPKIPASKIPAPVSAPIVKKIPAKPNNLSIKFIDPFNGNTIDVRSEDSWYNTIARKYNDLYNLNIPQFSQAVTTNRQGNHIIARLKPEYLQQALDAYDETNVDVDIEDEIEDDDEIKPLTKEPSNISKGLTKAADKKISVDQFVSQHSDYKKYKAPSEGAGSKIADKMEEIRGRNGRAGKFGENSTLINDREEIIALQGMYTIPMIGDDKHQLIYNQNPASQKLLKNLYSKFKHPDQERISQSISSLTEAPKESPQLPVFGNDPSVCSFCLSW